MFCHCGWEPNVRAENRADADESLRRHSNDRELILVEVDGSADYVGRETEPDLPGVIAENCNGSAAGCADLRRNEKSTFGGCEAEGLEVAGCDKLAEEAFGLGIMRKRKDQRR